ncbi:MAG: hypothetical protein Q8L37_03545 [Candidatus Gottesmanbacteria bacterium]|nr:hypothetical protein [Candidatus Gottesmanbacteria bacterium]
MIREASHQDIPRLVALDRASYGDYGADQRYFQKKFTSPNTSILIAQSGGRITGFVVFEVMKPGQQLENFSDLILGILLLKKCMQFLH